MSLSQQNEHEAIRQVGDWGSNAEFDEPNDEQANPISTLMVELSACLQMILTDVAQASDLEEARGRWVERLRSLAAFIERTLGVYTSANGQNQSSDPLSLGAGHAGLPDTVPHTHSRTEPKSSVRLTLREYEILNLREKGIPPRKIAARLQLSVQTVYTHLRNIRGKQRRLTKSL